ncbi:MAG: hypothetical protein AB1390_05945 [Nitrospirota bacterium]
MHSCEIITCPYFRENVRGTKCKVLNKLISEIEEIDTGICMSRYYETCYIYLSALVKKAGFSHLQNNDFSKSSGSSIV